MCGWIGSNYMMISKTKYLEGLMLIYIFLSNTLRKGREFTINTANRCLLRLIELQPSECPGGKFFLTVLIKQFLPVVLDVL